MSNTNPFWMIYGIGCGAPTHRHANEGDAKREAERLARSSPGTTFVILEAIAAVRKRDVEVTPIGRGGRYAIDDDIPF